MSAVPNANSTDTDYFKARHSALKMEKCAIKIYVRAKSGYTIKSNAEIKVL